MHTKDGQSSEWDSDELNSGDDDDKGDGKVDKENNKANDIGQVEKQSNETGHGEKQKNMSGQGEKQSNTNAGQSSDWDSTEIDDEERGDNENAGREDSKINNIAQAEKLNDTTRHKEKQSDNIGQSNIQNNTNKPTALDSTENNEKEVRFYCNL